MLAGMKLDLFTPLGDGGLCARALAEQFRAQPERLEALSPAAATPACRTQPVARRIADAPAATRTMAGPRPAGRQSSCE
jgi:hypothetical protein